MRQSNDRSMLTHKITQLKQSELDPPIARVLVVDNRDRVRTSLDRGLSGEGYAVQTVGGNGRQLYRAALKAARRFRPHVAIVDLRLSDDADTSDTTGIELLRKLKGICDGVQLIVYSAYLNPTIDRDISEIGATWIDKSDSPQLLKDTVAELANIASARSRAFAVRWPKDWNVDKPFGLFGEALPPSLVDDILSQLFARFKRLEVHHIEDKDAPSTSLVSRGRSIVVKVQPGGVEAQKVVKLAVPKRTGQEVRNYARYVEDRIPGHFHTRLENSRSFWDVGASVYNFLGDSGDGGLCTYRDFYNRETIIDQLLKPLRSFLKDAWHISPRHGVVNRSIVDEYDRFLAATKNQNRTPLVSEDLCMAAAGLIDPVQWMKNCSAQYAPKRTHRAIVHGDFHADNLFTDSQHLWVVDFERTGIGPIFADFCELEVDVLTRLLPDSVSLMEYRHLVECMLSRTQQPSPDIQLSPDSVKSLAFLRELREMAYELTKCTDTAQYEWSLLIDCMFVVGMNLSAKPEQEQMRQRARAWLYAAALCTKIERGQMT